MLFLPKLHVCPSGIRYFHKSTGYLCYCQLAILSSELCTHQGVLQVCVKVMYRAPSW